MNGLMLYLLGLLGLGIIVNIIVWGDFGKRTKRVSGIDSFGKVR